MSAQARVSSLGWFLAASLIALASASNAQTLSGVTLANALRQGGYVLVMRHTNSPAQPPAKDAADAENVKLERQLDSAGRDQARSIGEALKNLHLPVGAVFSSPTYRALQTVQLASLGNAQVFPELDEGAQGMQSNADKARSAWLRAKVTETPRMGTDTVIVTHAPNIAGAFGLDVAAGETVVFHPDGKGGAAQIARIKLGDWQGLAK
jgi:phosphohistidine phosphatase SixA